jgi:hypothetical protein
MKKNYFFLELLKSGPFLLLLILAILILLGIFITNRHQNTIQMKEDVLYVAPAPKK